MCAVRNQDMYRFLFMTLVQQGTFVFKWKPCVNLFRLSHSLHVLTGVIY
jgi:hypothetical protein